MKIIVFRVDLSLGTGGYFGDASEDRVTRLEVRVRQILCGGMRTTGAIFFLTGSSLCSITYIPIEQRVYWIASSHRKKN